MSPDLKDEDLVDLRNYEARGGHLSLIIVIIILFDEYAFNNMVTLFRSIILWC